MARKALVSHVIGWAFVVVASWLTSSCAASAKVTGGGNPSAKVDALFEKWSEGLTPGAAVLVIRDGKVVHRKGYGLAVVKTRTPIKPDTSFRLASLSKQFTAMAIMILAERGKLDFDDPLAKFFPRFPSDMRRITIRQLLHHLSGLPDHETLFLKRKKISCNWPRSAKTPPDPYEPTSHDALELLARQKQLEFAPGTEFRYSNAGYVVLGQIVEKVSRTSYGKFLKKEIFDRLGMHKTVVSDGKHPRVPNLALSYAQKVGVYCDIDYTPLNRIVGDDGVFSSLDDLGKWIGALKSEALVKEATLQLAFTPGRLKSGEITHYGFGWFLCERFGLKTIEHDGVWVGFRNFILDFPERKLTIVVLSNFDEIEADKLADEVAKIYLNQ